MKKNKIAVSAMALLLCGTSIVSCGGGDEKKEELNIDKEIKTPVKDTKELKLAFVVMDSIVANYEYQKDVEAEMKSKEEATQKSISAKESSAKNTLKSRAQAIQSRAAKFQENLKNNKITTQEQYEKEQAAIAKLQQDYEGLDAKLTGEYQEYAAKLTSEYQELAMKHTEAINDTIQHFLKLYGEEKGYDFLFGKSSSSYDLLYAKDAYDVTEEVLNALNERYKKYKK